MAIPRESGARKQRVGLLTRVAGLEFDAGVGMFRPPKDELRVGGREERFT